MQREKKEENDILIMALKTECVIREPFLCLGIQICFKVKVGVRFNSLKKAVCFYNLIIRHYSWISY